MLEAVDEIERGPVRHTKAEKVTHYREIGASEPSAYCRVLLRDYPALERGVRSLQLEDHIACGLFRSIHWLLPVSCSPQR